MSHRITWLVLLLIVLPTAILSLVAGSAVQSREQWVARRVTTLAASSVVDEFRRVLERDTEKTRRALTATLLRNGRSREIARIEEELIASMPSVAGVLVFMNPWGVIYPEDARTVPGGQDVVAAALRTRVANRATATDEAIAFEVDGAAYRFAQLREDGSLYAGCRFNTDLLLTGIARHIERLRGEGVQLKMIRPRVENDVQIEDPFGTRSSATAEPPSPVDRVVSLPLPPPFEAHRVVAWDATDTSLGKGAGSLHLWGIALLGLVIIAGVWAALREAAAEVRQARQRSAMLLSISHDLRTPLSSIRLLSETLMEDRVPAPARQQEFLRTISAQAERLRQMIERVLYLVKHEQNPGEYRRDAVELGPMVEACAESFRLQNTGGGSVELTVEVESGLDPVRGDARALEQVVMNLLDNARKYGGGRVRLGVKRTDNGVSIEVSDNGPGVDPAEMKRVFRPFYRGRREASSDKAGSGLGLAICRDVIRAHHGRIDVTRGPTGGAVFTVRL
jgi:signal transduction histidine kinase